MITKVLISVVIVLFLAGSGPGFADSEMAESMQSLKRTGQISCYDEHGKVIDFVGTGQDGEYQRGSVWPVPRFTHNGDGTVTDSLTGLMWLKDGDCFGALSWHSAVQRVSYLNKKEEEEVACHDYSAVYDDWQLPQLGDLESLLDSEEEIAANYLKLAGFIDIQAGRYWTNTAYMNPLNAWYVGMNDASVSFQNKMDSNFVLPVRHAFKPDEIKVAQDDKKNEQSDNPFQRFVDNGDGTISDIATGLMWLKDAGCVKEKSWFETLGAIAQLSSKGSGPVCAGYTAAYTDWSMPNRREMQSIIDYGRDFPALQDKHPFVNLSPSYWTSTTSPSSPGNAFAVHIYYGSVEGVAKQQKISGWPVRQIVPQTARPRETTRSGLGEEVDNKYVVRIDPELQIEVHWPPQPRFFDNGDGTSMDSLTGYTWLTDANCFGKLSWDETFKTMEKFNADPRKFECKGYEVSFGDWIVPSIEDLKEITNDKEKNSASWLEKQGIVNMQASGDYWSATPTLINLYYAYVLNFKNGEVHNYPKSLQFFFWPRRILTDDPDKQPLISMTVNAIGERVTLGLSDPFSISVYLHSFGIRRPADFWFWYETPDGQEIWLSPIRTWTTHMTPVYQGDLFNLKNYEIFRGTTTDLEPGDYAFYFAVDFTQDGVLDELIFQSRVIFTVD